jgi:hypothetical protein
MQTFQKYLARSLQRTVKTFYTNFHYSENGRRNFLRNVGNISSLRYCAITINQLEGTPKIKFCDIKPNARPSLHALPHHKERVTGLALVYKRWYVLKTSLATVDCLIYYCGLTLARPNWLLWTAIQLKHVTNLLRNLKICWQTRHNSDINAHTNACIGNKLLLWISTFTRQMSIVLRIWHKIFRFPGSLSVTQKTSSCTGGGGVGLYLTTIYQQNIILVHIYIGLSMINLKEHQLIDLTILGH